jgi:alpha-tubulin suppressor-like RCC1 family protein
MRVRSIDGNVFLGDITRIRAHLSNHSLAFSSIEGLLAWGDNSFGQLGKGGYDKSSLPILLKSIGDATRMIDVIELDVDMRRSFVIQGDGSLYAWGADYQDDSNHPPFQLGGQTNSTILTGCVAIAAGYNHAFTIHKSGSIHKWGNIGDVEDDEISTPSPIDLPGSLDTE